MASVQLTDSQKVTLGPVSAVDAKGNPTALGGAVTFTASDPAALSLVPSADGLSCDVLAQSALGTFQVVASDGVLSGSIDIVVVAGAEASLSIPAGAPVAQ